MMPYYNNYMGYGMGWGIFGGILSVIFWICIIMLVISIFRRAGRGRIHHWDSMSGLGKSATDIVKERYAKGEINKQEFEEKMKDLQAQMPK